MIFVLELTAQMEENVTRKVTTDQTSSFSVLAATRFYFWDRAWISFWNQLKMNIDTQINSFIGESKNMILM